jgi:hypothetical protein
MIVLFSNSMHIGFVFKDKLKTRCRAFAHDVTAAMLVLQFKIILIRLFCLKHQDGRHGFCSLRNGSQRK